MKRRYFNTREPGSFSGVSGFLTNTRYTNSENVLNTLAELKTVTLHKPARKNFSRRPVVCNSINYMWSSDIIVYSNSVYAYHNRNYKYILLTVDCLSKRINLIGMKKKDADSTHDALLQIFKATKSSPALLWTDEDKAYFSKKVKDMLKKDNVKLYHTFSKFKASLAERYVGRVKRVLARLFTKNGNKNWIDHLKNVQDSINNSYNRSIKMTPNQVNAKNEAQVWTNIYHKSIVTKRRLPKFKVGELVKIAANKLVFDKGYEQSFSSETFVIKQVKPLHPIPVYILSDTSGELVQGQFYEQELQKVSLVQNIDN